jgi:hypothetical protein
LGRTEVLRIRRRTDEYNRASSGKVELEGEFRIVQITIADDHIRPEPGQANHHGEMNQGIHQR